MDQATIDELVAEHPEAYRGGRIDAARIGLVSAETAWKRAAECLAGHNPARAAYWAGWAKEAET